MDIVVRGAEGDGVKRQWVLLWVGLAGLMGCEGCEGGEKPRLASGELTPSSDRIDFGAITLGLPVERTLGFSQRGLLDAEIARAWIEPANGPFLLAPLPSVVERDRGAEGRIVYTPMLAGSHRATLHLELERGEPVEVELEGRGVDARVEVLDPIDFGRPAIGTVRERVLRLENTFETHVPVRLAFIGADAHEFRTANELVLRPFSRVELKLSYAPLLRAGRREVALEFNACPLCAPTPLEVRADAVLLPIEIAPDPLLFGSVGVDAERVNEVFITNATDEPIRLESLGVAGFTDAGFSLEGPALPLMLGELETVSARVRFSPTRTGDALGALELVSNAQPVGRYGVSMFASGGGPQLVVLPERLDFRPVPVNARRTLDALVANGGADPAGTPLVLDSVRVEGEGFSLVTSIAAGTALGAGERLNVQVAFEPADERSHSGRLVIESSDRLRPRAEVALSGAATAAAACELVTKPAVLDFGLVHAAAGASLGVRIENAGAEPCALWNQRLVGDPHFELPRERGTVLLEPGQFFYMPVTFRPTEQRDYEATLSFDTNRSSPSLLSVRLLGGAPQSCLVPEPRFLSFGLRRLDCGPAELTGFWRNACEGPLSVEDIFLGAGADEDSFSIVSATATPAPLGRGELVEATVRWTPSISGYASRPLFARASDAEPPVLLTLDADVREEALHDELRVQPAPSKLDLLWVVDNTASMKDERAGLARSIGAFLASADARGIDYRIGVTTTGVGAPPGPNGEICPGGAGGAESGRLFPLDASRPRVVEPGQPERASILAANIEVGGCHSVEQGLLAAQLALSSPLVTGSNSGLIRPDAALAVVVVSDEDDESPDTAVRRARALRQTKSTSPFTFAAIVAPPGGCATAVEPGLRYREAAEELEGLVGSVCEADWSGTLDALADALFVPITRWVLDAEADPATLEVSLDGIPYAGWTYEAAERAVVFDVPPPAGALLRFRYREPCP